MGVVNKMQHMPYKCNEGVPIWASSGPGRIANDS
jgi:hypothetical protein